MAFLCYLLYLIVLYIRPAEWIEGFRGMQLADVTLLSAFFFLMFERVLPRKGLVNVPHTGLLLGLAAAVLFSHAVHTYLAGITESFTALAPVFLVFFLTVNTVTSYRRLQIVMWMLVLLTAVLALQGVYQFQTGYGWAGQSMAQGGRIRWISIFNDPNDLSLAFVIMVPVLLSYLVKPLFLGIKALPAGILALLLYGVFLTNSRGGVLGLAVAVVFFFVKRSRWVVPGGIIGGILAAPLFLFGPSRLGMTMDASAEGRLESWYYGFQLLKSSPLFGVGQNMFTNDYPLTAHNSFVLVAAELGVVGLFCWVGLFYAAFKGLSLVQKHCPGGLAHYAFGLQAALVGFVATTFFLSRAYNELPYLLCALSAALYAVALQYTDRVQFRITRREIRHIVLLSLGSLLLVQIAMKTWL